MRSLKAISIAIATAAASCSPASADRLDDIKARGTLICGTVPNFEPFSFPDPQTRKLVGYDMDFCDAIASKLGVKSEVKTSSNDGRIPELTEGRVDILTANLGYTPLRAQQVSYSLGYYVSPHRIVVRTDKNLNTLADMAGKRISFIKGSTTEAFVKNSIENPQMVNFDDAPTAFLALVQNKVDGFSASAIVGARLIGKSESVAALKAIDQPVGIEKWGIGVRRGEDRLLQQVNAILEELERSGEALSTHDKWLGESTIFKQKRVFTIKAIAD